MSAVPEHLSIEALLDYWLGDSDAATIEAVDEHLLGCDVCGQALDDLIALGEGMRTAFLAGAVSAIGGGAFVQRLAGQGLQVREYRLPHNGNVNCSVAPEDQLLVSRLEAPLEGVERLDVLTQLSIEPGVQLCQEDVPFDPQAGELVYISRLAQVRRLPGCTMELTLLAVRAGESREVGRYTFHHQPWPDR